MIRKIGSTYLFCAVFLIPVLWLACGIALIYSGNYFELDTDEGINLVKALLVNEGYPLYDRIWNDQPPLMTLLLAALFNVLEPTVNTARAVILFFSSVLVGEVSLILVLLGGPLHGILGAIFLILSPQFLRLSISVMIGLPSLTLATGAIAAILLWHNRHGHHWLIFSASLLALSALFKLFTVFLLPFILIGIFLDSFNRRDRKANVLKAFLPLALWTGTFALCIGILLVTLVGPNFWSSLLEKHLDARQVEVLTQFTFFGQLDKSFTAMIGVLALGGVMLVTFQRKWQFGYFIAWIIAGTFSLLNHSPIWYHHYLILDIPLAILAAYYVGETALRSRLAYRKGQELVSKRVLIALTGITFLLSGMILAEALFRSVGYLKQWQALSPSSQNIEYQILKDIFDLKPETKWMLTDKPMFAFRAAIPVPPETAVLSLKQWATGEMGQERIIEIIESYQPEQILFGRLEWDEVYPLIRETYRLDRTEQGYRLLRRQSVEP